MHAIYELEYGMINIRGRSWINYQLCYCNYNNKVVLKRKNNYHRLWEQEQEPEQRIGSKPMTQGLQEWDQEKQPPWKLPFFVFSFSPCLSFQLQERKKEEKIFINNKTKRELCVSGENENPFCPIYNGIVKAFTRKVSLPYWDVEWEVHPHIKGAPLTNFSFWLFY